jgi:hypothetical protein
MGRGGVLMGISPLQWFPANDPFPDKQSQMREYRDIKHGGEITLFKPNGLTHASPGQARDERRPGVPITP